VAARKVERASLARPILDAALYLRGVLLARSVFRKNPKRQKEQHQGLIPSASQARRAPRDAASLLKPSPRADSPLTAPFQHDFRRSSEFSVAILHFLRVIKRAL